VYAVPVWLGLTGDPSAPRPAGGGFTRTEIVGTLLSKLAASLLIAVSVAFVYLALRELVTESGARWITLGYAFATSAWAVSSQGLWQTTGSQVALAGAFLALLVARRWNTPAMIAWAGAAAAVAVACRPTAMIWAGLIAIYVVHVHRKNLLAFLPVPAMLGALLVAYNVYYFGAFAGGYESIDVQHVMTWEQISTGLQGLLLSPNRGLLTFSPVALAAVGGMVVVFRRSGELLLRYLAAGVILTVLFYSTLPQWHGQFSYSYRYLVDALPALALLTAPTWTWLSARVWRVATLGTVAAFSVFIQVVGVFYYPCGWYRSTRSDPTAMARFFDWHNLEVVQCLRNGPVDPDGLRFLRGLSRAEPPRSKL
jgi:hypothetical protein